MGGFGMRRKTLRRVTRAGAGSQDIWFGIKSVEQTAAVCGDMSAKLIAEA